jgi:hypothetical protein
LELAMEETLVYGETLMTGRVLLEILQSLPDHRLDLIVKVRQRTCMICECEHNEKWELKKVDSSPRTFTIWLEE